MRQLFKDKISKFGSLICLIAVTAMLVIFSLVLPEFIVSSAGRIFTGVWAVTAIMVFIAHVTRMDNRPRQYQLTRFSAKKDVRTSTKLTRTQRMMRG